jgi:glucuronate isomerase
MAFIHENFLLSTKTAQRLYHRYAEPEPILDYHCHLPPKDIAENRRFNDLFEIWLEGDHYKWRAMRANGVEEKYITGSASPRDKFMAWARTVPHTLRNPLYHWTHLELSRYFGIDTLLDESTAAAIWDQTSAMLAGDGLRVHGIFDKFHVRAVCTTDDPAEDLAYHKAIAESGLKTKVWPTFRPDKALGVHAPEQFNAWVDQLAATSNVEIGSLQNLLDALKQRHDFFHSMGGRLSDHGLTQCFASFCTAQTAAAIFDKARAGKAATAEEHAQFATFLMVYFGHLDAEKGWTKQLHIGALRAVNSAGLKKIGPDTGFDSIGDFQQAETMGLYLDRLANENALPKTIFYNNNPNDNYALATMAGNFPGVRFGSGWWYLDQKEAMEWQINALSNCGLLSTFVGMLTDSRSFMSYPRHEYFRRVLCNLIGRDVENGEIPENDALTGGMVRNICFANAKNYLGLDV